MATIHHTATISPTKAELLADWVPRQPWGADAVEIVGAYRFDDPTGAVGIESFVLRASDGGVVHVPLTYRDAPLAGAEDFLVCTMEHSVLGTRWIHDAPGDPVYRAVLTDVLRGSARQAEEYLDGADTPREPSVRVSVSGGVGGTADAVVERRPRPRDPVSDGVVLLGVWDGAPAPVVLARASG